MIVIHIGRGEDEDKAKVEGEDKSERDSIEGQWGL